MNVVILAGGTGTRLWPMSRTLRPKQFFSVVNETTLLQDTYRRLLSQFSAEHIYISTSAIFANLVRQNLPNIDPDHVIVEPEKRDTAPAMGYAAAVLSCISPDEPVVFIPSDHFIRDEELFLQCLSVADHLVSETGSLVDIGVRPTSPSTALGYTKIDRLYKSMQGIDVFTFAGHTEKPPLEIAEEYLADGRYLWHANYYTWTPRFFLEAFDRFAPEAGKTLRVLIEAIQKNDSDQVKLLYHDLPAISFDYLITEKMSADDVRIIRGDFGWSDIGTWDTVYERLAGDKKNVCKGSVVTHETTGSLIYADSGRTIAVLGMDDIIVVDTEDALLICPRGEAQRLKELIARIKDEGYDGIL